MDCVCRLLLTPQQILAANAELPYCDAHGCFDIPLVAPPADDATTVQLLLTAAIIGAAMVFHASAHAEECA